MDTNTKAFGEIAPQRADHMVDVPRTQVMEIIDCACNEVHDELGEKTMTAQGFSPYAIIAAARHTDYLAVDAWAVEWNERTDDGVIVHSCGCPVTNAGYIHINQEATSELDWPLKREKYSAFELFALRFDTLMRYYLESRQLIEPPVNENGYATCKRIVLHLV